MAEEHPDIDGLRTGAHPPYRWLTSTDHCIDAIVKLCPEVVLDRHLVVTSIDSGFAWLTEQQQLAKWECRSGVVYSPRLTGTEELFFPTRWTRPRIRRVVRVRRSTGRSGRGHRREPLLARECTPARTADGVRQHVCIRLRRRTRRHVLEADGVDQVRIVYRRRRRLSDVCEPQRPAI